jgi:tetratricopeptide (TPR) repeat protein
MLSLPTHGLHPLLLPCVWLALALPATAAPHLPASDAQVVERVPARAADPRVRDLQALRAAWRASPRDADLAVRLARRYIDAAAAEGDPRYVGYAQAALAPWWNEPAPPVAVRVQRAVLRQYGHQFAEALADLDAAVRAEPANAEAWSWLAAIHLVRADYAAAIRGCDGLAPLTTPLLATACRAAVDSLTGRAEAAANSLGAALTSATDAGPEERLWALTRMAEIAERRGEFAAAERAFREALGLGVADVYLQAAYADFLLDRGRPAEVLSLLRDGARADVLLLRLALAAKATRDPRAKGWISELGARFAAARARGDRTHEKEEARFRLELQGDAAGGLALAGSNYAVQREPADARILLEAAIAARQPGAAAPVRDWLSANRVESVVLQALAAKTGAAK